MQLAKNNNRLNYFRGLATETVVAWVYFASGYKVLARRYKTKVGEVDLIAVKDNLLSFVEVKLRADAIISPDSPVSLQQQKRIAHSACCFLAERSIYHGCDISFDLAIASSMKNINIIKNAWQCDDWDLYV